MRQPVSHAKHNETHMSELLNRRQRLRKRKKRNIILNTVCILLVLCAIVWTVDYFWRYFKYETTNDAVIDQYISPVGIRVSGYIKEVRFTEHQPVKAGDTLLVLDDRGTDGCQGFGNGARVGYSRIGSQRIGAGSQHSRNPGAVVAIGTGLPEL